MFNITIQACIAVNVCIYEALCQRQKLVMPEKDAPEMIVETLAKIRNRRSATAVP